MRIDFHEIKGTEQYLIFNGTKMELMCMEAVIILLQAKKNTYMPVVHMDG